MTSALAASVALTLGLAAVEALLRGDGHLPPGTVGLFGIVGCVAIVLAAKRLGKAWLQRREPPDDGDE